MCKVVEPRQMEFNTTRLAPLLDALCVAYQSKGIEVSESLQPALTEAEIRQHIEGAKLQASSDILELYGWRNGSVEGSTLPLGFVGKAFVPLDRAMTERHLMLTALGRDGEDGLESMLFPFAVGDGGWYAVEAGNDNSPVYLVVEVAELHFESVEAMVKTCVEWIAEPDWSLTERPARAQAIWYKHNPSVDE